MSAPKSKNKKQDIIVLISSFIIGIIAGSYFFISGFAPTFEEAELPSNNSTTATDALVIESEQYGGLRVAGSVPTFRLTNDGVYRYVPLTPAGETVSPATGMIRASTMADLVASINATVLADSAAPYTPEFCAQMVDGVDYRYTITWKGETYKLDTCGTHFTHESPLGIILLNIWNQIIADQTNNDVS